MQTTPAQNISDLMTSPAYEALWAEHYAGQKHEAPIKDIAGKINAINGDWHAHPEILAFMINLVEIETAALPASERAPLQSLQEYLEKAAAGIALPKRKHLPEEQQKILNMIERESGLQKFRPVSWALNMAKTTGTHIFNEAMEHKKSSALLAGVAILSLVYMHRMGALGSTAYMSPEETMTVNFSLDALDDPNWIPEIDESLFNPDFIPSCHDHLRQLLGETGADFVKETLEIANFFPQHCSKMKTLAMNAGGMYDTINSRIAALIENPVLDLGDTVLQDSPLKTAFETAATNTAEFWYAANYIENIAFHTGIFGLAMASAFKLSSLSDEERQEIITTSHNFLCRTLRKNPLNYIFTAAGASVAYIQNTGEMNPDIIWMGAIGGLAGHFAHQAMRRLNRSSQATLRTAKISQEFITTADPDLDPKQIPKSKLKDIILGKSFTGRLMRLAPLLSALDLAVASGTGTGSVLGAAAVTIPFLAYNIPEDMGLHVIFGIAGGTVGLGLSGMNKAKNSALGLLRNKNTEPPAPL